MLLLNRFCQFYILMIIYNNYICNLNKMAEIKNKKNPIAGYMGYVPSGQDRDQSGGVIIDSHIPGYVGYIPAVKS